MKKLLMIGLSALILTGCAAKVTKTYTISGEGDGYTYESVDTVTAQKDEVINEVVVTTYTVTEFTEEEVEEFKSVLDEEVTCPYGVADDNGAQTVGCSKYIKVSYTYDEATKTIVITEEFDFKSAAKAKEDIVSEEAGGSYSSNAYYSLKEFEADFISEGYELQK